ncbi:helix-turn-helix domain-containing protein [Fundicoccus sp. Sow4_H7]|uniref:helix-turn-helix domain-containing protein n=1 Tax=Fundicoccus sp. Sow4_H7 TaxID=3438784 RepID=UPI003F8E8C82
MDKYRVIAPYLNHEESLKNITEESGFPKRTLYHWINQHRQSGLKGLVRKM